MNYDQLPEWPNDGDVCRRKSWGGAACIQYVDGVFGWEKITFKKPISDAEAYEPTDEDRRAEDWEFCPTVEGETFDTFNPPPADQCRNTRLRNK